MKKGLIAAVGFIFSIVTFRALRNRSGAEPEELPEPSEAARTEAQAATEHATAAAEHARAAGENVVQVARDELEETDLPTAK